MTIIISRIVKNYTLLWFTNSLKNELIEFLKNKKLIFQWQNVKYTLHYTEIISVCNNGHFLTIIFK